MFGAYLVDFTWKIVQVKLALMVRQLNYKVVSDLKERDRKFAFEVKKLRAENAEQVAGLEKEIARLKATIGLQQTTIDNHLKQI